MPGPLSRVRPWWPALAYMALIWSVSSLSSPPSTRDLPFRDKGVHAVEYGVLAVLTARGFAASLGPGAGLRLVVYNVTLGSFWGLVDEIHQAYVPGRSSELADVLADFIGAVLGTGVYVVVRRRRA